MTRRFFILLIAAFGSTHAVDFTPVLSVKKLERFSVPVLTFSAGDGRISYKPPYRWQSSGSPETLTLTPIEPSGASMTLMTLRWSVEQSAKLATPESEQKWAFSFLPAEAAEVMLTASNESPFTLGAHTSREWIVKYRMDGILRATSISRCDLSINERIVIVMTSAAKDFDTFRQDGISSLFSWEWL